MGGDNAPLEIVKGAVAAADLIENEICIIGKQEEIREALSKQNYEGDKITTCDAREVISMEDSPVRAVRVKKDSSIVKGINMVKSGEADLFVSSICRRQRLGAHSTCFQSGHFFHRAFGRLLFSPDTDRCAGKPGKLCG